MRSGGSVGRGKKKVKNVRHLLIAAALLVVKLLESCQILIYRALLLLRSLSNGDHFFE